MKKKVRYHSLTSQEEAIISQCHTEKPGSGTYDRFHQEGIYLCRRCDAPLYCAENKFSSGCGWPSFDEEIEGSVLRLLDPDGSRVEIRCAACNGHLGHVFSGERFTPKNVRHCVNSLSLRFVSQLTEEGYENAFFAGGCFWGVEYFLKKEPGVIETSVGFMGGTVVDPTYEEVCEGNTGQLETTLVVFDPKKVNFEKLARLFFEVHDPTEYDRQGPDVGEQYGSAIFYLSQKQKNVALSLIEILKNKGLDVATRVIPAHLFYPADAYHQDYYQKVGKTPYCHKRTSRF